MPVTYIDQYSTGATIHAMGVFIHPLPSALAKFLDDSDTNTTFKYLLQFGLCSAVGQALDVQC